MKVRASALFIAAAVGMSAAALVGTPTASAGDSATTASIQVRYYFNEGRDGSAASLTQAEVDATDPELFMPADPDPIDISNTGMCDEDVTGSQRDGENGRWAKILVCGSVDATGDTYDFGIAQLPARYFISSVNCYGNPGGGSFSGSGQTITPVPGDSWECIVNIDPKPLVFIDKVVSFDSVCGGFDSEELCLAELDLTWDPTDFPLEVYDADGELVPFDAPILDPSQETCVPDNNDEGGPGGQIPFFAPTSADLMPVDDSLCVSVPLAPGDYTMGEVLPSHGYEPSSLDCRIENPGGSEMLPADQFGFVVSTRQAEATFCTLVNDYVTQTVVADLVIEGDPPATTSPEDFVINVIKTGDGQDQTVATGFDPEPGQGNASAEFELPIGAYRLGVEAPEGYTATVVVTPDPVEPPVGRSEKAAALTDADFVISRSVRAAGVITVSFAVATTTTTSTTTTTTTTTVAPTTTAPTAEAPATTTAPVVTTTPAPPTTVTSVLPATGNSASQTSTLLALAIGMLFLGGGVIVATRRR